MSATFNGGGGGENDARAAIKLQAFVRAAMCRAQVSDMVKELIEELVEAKKIGAAAIAADRKVEGRVVPNEELGQSSVHDIVNNLESPKSITKEKIAAPTDVVEEMHGSVKNIKSMFESPIKARSPKKKFWSADNRGAELGDDNSASPSPAAAAVTSSIQSPDLLSSASPQKVPVKEKGLVSTHLTNNSTKHVASSQDIVHEQEARLNAEMQQLVKDIKRLGEKGTHACTFGELFDDEQVANYYEALVGTLKAAKRRGVVHYEGQMLLKGISDSVVVSIVK